jgi:putative nucleotidyltransferase-like protein
MAPSMSPEFRLAAACAMWPPSHRRREAVRTAATGSLDWPRFIRVARRHQVIALVHDGLTRAATDVPPEIAWEIGERAETLVRENLALACESLRIQRLFDDADLPVLFLKGTPLAVLAFGNLSLREAQDIDLVVPDKMLPEAMTLLARAGYRRFDPPTDISDTQLRLLLSLRKDLGFIHQATGLRVELHWRLFLNAHAMAEASIMAASRVVPLTDIAGLRTMGDEDLFAYLCMHGALHWWNRLKWIADVNALLASRPDDEVELLFHAAEARGVGRAAAQALLLCRRLMGTNLPTRLTTTLDKSATLRWLEATALNAVTTGQGEHHPHEVRFGTTRGSFSTVLLSRHWRYWLAELKVHLTNETDILTVPLPETLRFLYPILRLPLWCWRHAAKHGAKR